MPNIGEVKRGVEIGFKSYSKHIWQACIECGKERWVKLTKGEPDYNICRSCLLSRRGSKHSAWKGGKVTKTGYKLIKLTPDDFFYSMVDHQSYVLEHRLVMAKHLGRCLHSWEIVHHKGTKYPKGSKENRGDNRLENLQLVTDDRHKQITILERRISFLEQRVTLLEAENIVLKRENSLLK